MTILDTFQTSSRRAATVARIGSQVLWERLANPRPVRATDVPYATEAMTCEWLTAVLCGAVPGAEVTGIALGAASSGSTDRRAFEVSYNDVGKAAGLPTQLFNKCGKGFFTRLMMVQCCVAENEVGFYSAVRPELAIETPRAYYAALDHRSWRSALVLEDVLKTKQATILDPQQPVSRGEIEGMLDLLATVHGKFWESPLLDSRFNWLKTPAQWIDIVGPAIEYEARSAVGMQRAAAVVPAALRGRESDIYRAFLRAMCVSSEGPLTYLHGDPHVRNYYRTGAGAIGIVDWQVTFKGGWGHDFAYTMLSSLSVADRRSWEPELLRFYLERLEHHGAKAAPSFAQAWDTYCQQTLYTLVGWLYTIGFGPLQPNMQPDHVSMIVIERAAAAVEDLESLRRLLGRSQ